jgi:ubiquinone/menaquinone biosynthesis C-methylase UbiE
MLKFSFDPYNFFCVGSGYPFDLDMVADRDSVFGQEKALVDLVDPAGKRILDAGCGLGRFSSALASEGANVTGVDIVQSLVSEAKRRDRRVNFVRADLASLPFQAERFDAISCMYSSFGYSRGSALKELRELRRVCRLGAVLVVDVANARRPGDAFGVESLPEGYGLIFRWRWFGMLHQVNMVVARHRLEFYRMSVTNFSFRELRKCVSLAGWRIDQAFGDYKLNPFNSMSPRILLRCLAV